MTNPTHPSPELMFSLAGALVIQQVSEKLGDLVNVMGAMGLARDHPEENAKFWDRLAQTLDDFSASVVDMAQTIKHELLDLVRPDVERSAESASREQEDSDVAAIGEVDRPSRDTRQEELDKMQERFELLDQKLRAQGFGDPEARRELHKAQIEKLKQTHEQREEQQVR